MYASVRRYQIDPSHMGETMRKVHDDFVSQLRTLPGLVSYYQVHGEDGAIVAVSIFEDRAASEEADRVVGEWAKANLSGVLVTPPDALNGEVVLHEVRRR